MFFHKLYRVLALLLCFVSCAAFADEPFVVKRIEVEGLQRIPSQTVLEYLPIHEGQTLAPMETGAIISALYKTGFFSDVQLARRGNTLVIQVIERSTIGLIKITGNKQIKTKDLMEALRHANIYEGEAVNQATLAGMKQALQEQYYNLGRYNATIETKLIQQSRNRVEIDINISEGNVAKVKEINLISNQAFSTRKLRKNFQLTPHHWWTFWSSSDEYSADKLHQDMEALRVYYYDRGYLKFSVDSSQVTITPNKKDVYITMHVTEGDVYRIKGFNFSGNLLGHEAALRKLIKIKPDEIFSRKKIMAIDHLISQFYANQGYGMATVIPETTLDEPNKKVFVTFVVNPGKRVYVRHINFYGNTRTSEEVFRRETRQMEGGVYSSSQLEETKRRLNNLGYVENVQMRVEPVPERPEQVDIKYTLKETSSTTASAQVGYSDSYGFMYGGNLVQKNFRGEGKTVSVGFNNSQFSQTYSFNYFNPYYTTSGISRGFTLYFQETTPGAATNTAPYNLDAYGGNVNYRLPLSEYDYLSFALGYEYLQLKSSFPSVQIINFIQANGDHFNNIKGNLGWIHNNFDRAIFPTKGISQSILGEVGLPLISNSLDYYRVNYNFTIYHPIASGFIVEAYANLGYGNGYGNLNNLPFFKNYFAGGIGTVRGYESNTLGPKDSNGNPFGGNVLTTASLNLIIPNPISEKFRTSIFVDGGTVYQNTWNTNGLRFSAGIGVDWISPMGPLKFSLAKPLNAQSTDATQIFQFSGGTSF